MIYTIPDDLPDCPRCGIPIRAAIRAGMSAHLQPCDHYVAETTLGQLTSVPRRLQSTERASMTACDGCDTRLVAGQARVYVPDHGEVAVALCRRCSTCKPESKVYTPTGVSKRSRINISERGRT